MKQLPGNEALRAHHGATRSPCLLALVAFASCAHLGIGAASHDIEIHSVRGLRGHRRKRNDPLAPVGSFDDLHEPPSFAPLYDDFLDMINDASGKALEQHRAAPAYKDFLHMMKMGAQRAHREQVTPPSYDAFLNGLNGASTEAYKLQQAIPSYDDFLAGLKVGSVEARKSLVPKYEDFLKALKAGAEKAMMERLQKKHQDIPKKSLDYVAQTDTLPTADLVAQNKYDPMNPIEQEPQKEDDDAKLKRELRELKAKSKSHKGDKKPLMRKINVLRTQLCWRRPQLWKHEKCLRFLGINCLQASTGEGICRAFAKEAKKRCETSNDPKWKQDYCALSDALEEQYGEDEQSDKMVQDQLAEEGRGTDGEGQDGVGSNADLDKELQREDEKLESDLDDDLIEDNAGKAEAIQDGKGNGDEVVEDAGKEADQELADGAKGGKDGQGGKDGKKGAEDLSKKDTDGDGITDDKDKFVDDPNEWADTDGDGIGDNADQDIDGDGRNNDVDAFPLDKKEWKDSDGDGIGDNSDKDRDNDGVENDKDKFPDDPTEWLDSDGDGVGDNKDGFPYNPNCTSAILPCADENKKLPKKGSAADPTSLDMNALRPVPEQGYNEAMVGPPVNHENYYTYTSDWQDEWPDMPYTEKSTLNKICREHPDNTWCRRFKHFDAHFR